MNFKIGTKHTTYVGGKRYWKFIFFTSSLLSLRLISVDFQFIRLGMDENHPSQGSVRLLRRGGHQRLSSSSSASSSASRSVAFVAMIPHSFSHHSSI
jgi:hypothetical protein